MTVLTCLRTLPDFASLNVRNGLLFPCLCLYQWHWYDMVKVERINVEHKCIACPLKSELASPAQSVLVTQASIMSEGLHLGCFAASPCNGRQVFWLSKAIPFKYCNYAIRSGCDQTRIWLRFQRFGQ